MPIVMSGYIVADTRKLAEHVGHTLGTDGTTLFCERCRDASGAPTLIEREHTPRPSLPCGCSDQKEHDDGVAIQKKLRKAYRMTRSACPGCVLGDDGPSIHDCYIHRA